MANATLRTTGQVSAQVAGKGDANNVKVMVSTIELAAATASGATVDFCRIPSNARILGNSRLFWDDLSSLSATLDLGFAPVNANITASADCLTDGLDIGSASNGLLVKDPLDVGKQAWDISTATGVTADPGGEFIVRGTVLDAANTAAGTLTLELYYTFD